MADCSDMPEATKIVPKDFRLVTKSGNELIKVINTTRDAEDHPNIIKEGLETVIREYISIIVEKTNLSDLIDSDEKYKFLTNVDVKSIFEPKKLAKNPTTEKSQFLIEQSIKNQDKILKKMETIDRLDQVINY